MTRDQMEARLREIGADLRPGELEGMSDTEIHQLLIRTLSDRLNESLEEDHLNPPEVIPTAALSPEHPGVELSLPEKVARPPLPTAAVWAHLATMAEPLAASTLVKPALRGKPNDVLMVLLTGWDLQITATQALAKVHIIEGQPAASPELILGLIRREGHLVWPGGHDNSGIEQESEDIATLTGVVHAVRRDDPERIITVRFSLAQAAQANLCRIVDGKVQARSDRNHPKPWELYTEDLLWARAVSRLGRRNFSDVLLGLSYVPEELEYIDARSYESPAPASSHDPQAQVAMQPSRLQELRDRIGRLPDDVRAELRDAWDNLVKHRALPPLDRLYDSQWANANDLITNFERKAEEAKLPPCESEEAEASFPAADATPAGDGPPLAEGLPFACGDVAQEEPRVCPHAEQCREADECLLAPF